MRELTLSNQNGLRQVTTAVRPSTIDMIAERFTCADCTLNGHPARIKGRLLMYAIVTPDDPSIPTAEFSWQAVERIMTEGNRAFRS